MTTISKMRSSQTILTKYLGPTNTKGARIQASCDYQCKLVLPYDHELSGLDNHVLAAIALANQYFPRDLLGAETELLRCDTPGDSGYMFITIPNGYKA